MEGSICAPLLAESDTENNIISTHNVASVSDADTVINTNNTNSSQIEGEFIKNAKLQRLVNGCPVRSKLASNADVSQGRSQS